MSSKFQKNAAILLALEGIMLQTVVVVSFVVAFLTSNERGTHRQRKSRRYNRLNWIPDQVDSNAGLMHSPSTSAEEEVSDEDEITSVCQREKRKTNGKKRKSRDEDTRTQLIETLCVFMQSTEAKFGQILQLIGYEQDAVVRRNELFAQLEKIEGLLMMDKLRVSDELIMCPQRLDFFWGLPETERKDYVQMLLAKLST